MFDLTPQPRRFDAVLGGETLSPLTGAVLGGWTGAKQRLESDSIVARLAALKEIIQYGDRGIDLVIQALNDPAKPVRRLACRLLRQEERGQDFLLNHQPLGYFTTFVDWQVEPYDPQVGITDPEMNAYAVRMANTGREHTYDLSQFEALLQDPRVADLQALVFEIDYNIREPKRPFSVAVTAICEAQARLPSLKALSVKDSEDGDFDCSTSRLIVSDFHLLLKAFPHLEVLQLHGANFDSQTISDWVGLHHSRLKTLMIHVPTLRPREIEQFCAMKLPRLEYFDMWLYPDRAPGELVARAMTSLLVGESYPNLKYLGMCGCLDGDTLIKRIIKSPIMNQLIGLDLKINDITDVGAEVLWRNQDQLPNLKFLDLSRNYIREYMVAQFQKLPCQVEIADQTKIWLCGRWFLDGLSDE
ncbi:hypothetical protein [Pantanalinema sp. GBBB05]|uniref:hypothetical protein n=1 Tax=Pantanalinema sp. GBBB05 TaxID=2604139 RepID=UPI001D6FF52E|nr:hypothetical protein [Pantanalinema sp. GBBB05]